MELTEASLAAAEASGALNAFSALTPERARYQASLAAARLKEGEAPDLCGIPLGIKDLFCVEDAPAQAASRILEGFRPPYESTVTREALGGGRGLHRQAQHGRVRHGELDRDLGLRPGGQPLAAAGRQPRR